MDGLSSWLDIRRISGMTDAPGLEDTAAKLSSCAGSIGHRQGGCSANCDKLCYE